MMQQMPLMAERVADGVIPNCEPFLPEEACCF